MDGELVARLGACEQKNRRLGRLVAFQFVALAASLVLSSGSLVTPVTSSEKPAETADRLRVRELVVVDPQGVERVRISGDFGDEARRGSKAAGLILYDGTGEERGGYVTWEPSGNVGLTLDTRKGMVAQFLAGPDDGSALMLWHGKDLLELRSDHDGSRLTVVKDGRVFSQEPRVSMAADACTAYREARARVPKEKVLEECRRRFTEAACRACLGQ